ncbi:MAG TPA: hypothetical protein VK164_05930 [Flavobacterium sp.]|uniref:hypothetical protein n=1 Tax=Flavobacterium sp. TaxID=239 RepID=UPI002B4B3443|nr:hypothetical protein [Flavobacterium sp.]HLO73456.1 hypothetical protein [Flavobacterium sp.]
MEKEVYLSENSSKKIANAAIGLYFIVNIIYLVIYKIFNDVDLALYFKPLIVPSIAFAYFFLTKKKNYLFNMLLYLVIYFADNLILLEDRSLYIFSTYLYLIAISILFYYVVSDSRLFRRMPIIERNYPYFLLAISSGVVIYKILNFIYDIPFKEAAVVLLYIFMFLTVLIISIYNAIRAKSIASRFLLFMLLCLFLSDTFEALNSYYLHNNTLIFLSCLVDVPIYYFLLKYLLHREHSITR